MPVCSATRRTSAVAGVKPALGQYGLGARGQAAGPAAGAPCPTLASGHRTTESFRREPAAPEVADP
jgi:hypothetical protein